VQAGSAHAFGASGTAHRAGCGARLRRAFRSVKLLPHRRMPEMRAPGARIDWHWYEACLAAFAPPQHPST
jgi:hypothetical protein